MPEKSRWQHIETRLICRDCPLRPVPTPPRSTPPFLAPHPLSSTNSFPMAMSGGFAKQMTFVCRQRAKSIFQLRPGQLQLTSRTFSTVQDAPILSVSSTHPPLNPAPKASATLHNALQATLPRTTWTREEIAEVYNTPLMELSFAAVSCLLISSREW
jgi:hypothetical protein